MTSPSAEPRRQEAHGGDGAQVNQIGQVIGDVHLGTLQPAWPCSFGVPNSTTGYVDRSVIVPGPTGGLTRRVLLGSKGMGKTQLAIHHARDLVTSRSGLGVIWVSAPDLTVVLPRLAGTLGVPPREGEGLTDLAERVRAKLESAPGPWLVVIDAFDEPDAALSAVMPNTAPCDGCQVLITTTNGLIARQLDPTPIPVAAMSPVEAIKSLCGDADGADNARRAAAAIAQHLGYHPLALGVARQLRTPLEPLAELWARLHNDVTPIIVGASSSYDRTFVDLWVLACQKSGPDATSLAEVVSYCASSSVPLSMLSFADDQHRQRDAVSALNDAGLVALEFDDDRVVGVVMHQMISAAGRLRSDEGRGPILERLLLGATRATDAGDASIVALHVVGVGSQADQVVEATRLNALGTVLESVEFGTCPREIHERLWASGEATFDQSATTQGALYLQDQLAKSYLSAGRATDALALQLKVLAHRQHIMGTDHPDTLTTQNNLAISHQAAGRTTEAITLWEQVLAHRQRVLGTDHPDTLGTRSNLASSYASEGRITEAITVQEEICCAPRSLGTRG